MIKNIFALLIYNFHLLLHLSARQCFCYRCRRFFFVFRCVRVFHRCFVVLCCVLCSIVVYVWVCCSLSFALCLRKLFNIFIGWKRSENAQGGIIWMRCQALMVTTFILNMLISSFQAIALKNYSSAKMRSARVCMFVFVWARAQWQLVNFNKVVIGVCVYVYFLPNKREFLGEFIWWFYFE